MRVLALDGGGIRGVVQLEILRAIERALGKHLPVQVFFDLMVGTGTGGLIAVALAEQGRTLDQCQDMFSAVCKQAYNDKTPGKALVKRFIRGFGSRSRYGASALHKALKKEFSDKSDFFGDATEFRPDAKVAVIATSAIRHKTTLLSNYRRAGDRHLGHEDVSDGDRDLGYAYDYERPHDPADELKTWQAVYATMADPQYFAPLSSGRQYGGTSKFSNTAPVALAEAQKIWPDVEEPDLLLSLGTGQNRTAVLAELLANPARENATDDKPWFREGLEKAQSITKWWLRNDSDILDAERVWQDFASTTVSQSSVMSRRRRVRFNVDIGEPPAQHRGSQIQRVSTLVRDKLQEEHRLAALTNVAHRLIATSFYYQTGATTTDVRGVRYTIGHISCRFDSHSDYIKRLGKLLEDRCKPEFEPFFSTGPSCIESRMVISMTRVRLSRMIQHGVFDLPEIKLPVGSRYGATSIRLHLLQHDRLEPEGYPISGVFHQKVEDPGRSSSRSTSLEAPRSEKPTGRSWEKDESSPPVRPQIFQRPFHLSTAALLKSVSLPYQPSSIVTPHVLDSEKLSGGKPTHVDESPPPYEFGTPG